MMGRKKGNILVVTVQRLCLLKGEQNRVVCFFMGVYVTCVCLESVLIHLLFDSFQLLENLMVNHYIANRQTPHRPGEVCVRGIWLSHIKSNKNHKIIIQITITPEKTGSSPPPSSQYLQ